MLTIMPEPKKRGPSQGDVRMTFDMPEDLRRRIKVLAAQKGKQMKDLLLTWVRQGVEQAERDQK